MFLKNIRPSQKIISLTFHNVNDYICFFKSIINIPDIWQTTVDGISEVSPKKG